MRNVVVTGGSRGLGLASACALRDAGYQVIAVARSQGKELAAALREPPIRGGLDFHPFDLADLAEIPDLVGTIRDRFGPIYGLVNNAAVGSSGILAMMRNDEIERLVEINLLAPIILSKFAVRSMLAHGGGRIVNIASVAGLSGYSGLSVYSATKAALIGFTRSLAREVGPAGINVNAVAPGLIETQMTLGLDGRQRGGVIRRAALRRLAEARDVAAAVEFLIGEGARNITGTVMTVDAGVTA